MLSHTVKKVLLLALVSGFVSGVSVSAMAQTSDFNRDRPRRAEVNKRLSNQNKRINKEVKKGDLTKTQAAALHKDDRKIRKEERLMASQNGGHITKQEQRTLNQQENVVSKKIGQ